jgi:hypothetical protein
MAASLERICIVEKICLTIEMKAALDYLES